uniref:Lipocalin/cytosolic fatty-acid binding domain-containing protein n=1 Tax=Amblyomma maculatum TaxID=34609 RepID=G3MQF3_AMBMU
MYTESLSELITFLDTDDKIWLVLKSIEDRSEVCVNNKRVKLENDNYDFTQSFVNIHGTQERQLHARLQEENDTGTMDVSAQKGQSGTKYSFRHYNVNEECALMTYEGNGRTECHLYVRNAKLADRQPRGCEKVYDIFCQEKHQISNSACENYRATIRA